MSSKFYQLPELPYQEADLEPVVSEEQLKLHYEKHHKAYVDKANELLEKLERQKQENVDLDLKSILKELSFNVGGHVLHSLFWDNMMPQDQAKEMSDEFKKIIVDNFGSVEKFKSEFSKTAKTCEGSGWAALTYCKKTDRLILMQVEKHNVNVFPMFEILLALDVWEHAYYLDYQNQRQKYIENFWNIINWQMVEERYKEAKKQTIQ